MKLILYICVAMMLLLTSCEKDLNFKYDNTDPRYVIEATITNEGAKAFISQTLDMESAEDPKGVSGAELYITGDDGEVIPLKDNGDGTYTSDTKAVAGHEYVLTAKIGNTFTQSSSIMQSPLELDSVYFAKTKMVHSDMYLFMVDILTDQTDNNFYQVLMYKNGEYYDWAASNNHGAPKVCEMGIGCYFSKNEDDEEKIIHTGDTITAEIRRISEKSYNFLDTVYLGEKERCNPAGNFSNGVLGYFSAHYVERITPIIYDESKVEDLK